MSHTFKTGDRVKIMRAPKNYAKSQIKYFIGHEATVIDANVLTATRGSGLYVIRVDEGMRFLAAGDMLEAV